MGIPMITIKIPTQKMTTTETELILIQLPAEAKKLPTHTKIGVRNSNKAPLHNTQKVRASHKALLALTMIKRTRAASFMTQQR